MAGQGDDHVSSSWSVTEWVNVQKAGGDASRELWERYIDEVVRACDARLTPNERRAASGGDLAQEVFRDFFAGIREGVFPRLENRRDVVQILRMLAARAAIDHRRHHRAQKAGGGRVLAFAELDPEASGMAACDVPARPAAPADEEELRAVLQEVAPHVADPLLQNLVCDRIMGYTNEEIALRRGVSRRTVVRRLQGVVAKPGDGGPPRP